MENLIPHSKHLEVVIVNSAPAFATNFTTCWLTTRVELINEVPVLCFITEDQKENFFIHFNYPDLKQSGPTEWMNADMIKIMLVVKDSAANTIIVGTRIVTLSLEDTYIIKTAMHKQTNKAAQEIDAAVDHLYSADFADYEWLK